MITQIINHTALWERFSKRIVFLFAFLTVILNYAQHYESIAVTGEVAGGTAADKLFNANLFLTTAPTTAVPIRIRTRLVSGGAGTFTFTATSDNIVFTSNNAGGAANGSVIEFTLLTAASTLASPTLYAAQDVRFAITDLDGPTNEAIFANCSTGPKFMAVSKSPASNLTAATTGSLLRVDGTANQSSEVTSTVIYEYQKKNTFTFTSFGNNNFLKEFDLNYNNFQIPNPQYYTCAINSDGDAVNNVTDQDDDNDGITDIVESGGNNPDGDADGDGLPNYLDTFNNLGTDPAYVGDGSTTNYTDANNNGIPDVYDFDGDGIPNHLDLDSDNDGCFDALESTGGLVSTQAPSGVISGTVSANGIPASAGSGFGIGSSQNSSQIKCNDFDLDGIPNSTDLDDDNDGIPDSVECPPTQGVTNGTFNTNLNGWTSSPTGAWVFSNGTAVNETDGAANQTLSQTLNNLNQAANGIVSLSVTIGAQDGTNLGGNTASLQILLGNTVYATLNNGTARIANTNNVTMTLSGGATSNFTPFSTAAQNGYTAQTFTISIPYTGAASAALVFRMSATADDWSIDNVSVPLSICDLDNDGIPNYLDLDSDGDGCFDAVEGDENVTGAQLNANGSIPGAVNANGVPNLVNTGGVADIGGDVGQGLGTSQNAAVQDVECSTAIGCTNAIYLAQFDTLYSVNTSSNPFTYPPIGVNQAGNYNAIGINPLNGRMYGMLSASSNNLLVINADGSSINLGPITGLPAASYNSGEIDNLGNYYLKAPGDNTQLYRVNLTTLTATLITLNTSISVSDLAFRTTNGLLYSVKNDTGQLVSINPSTGAVVGIGGTPGAVAFGALFGSSTGEIFGADNAGGFYQFNITTGARVLISGSPTTTGNDGAHCVTTPIAFSADLAITKTDNTTTYAPGSTRVYTIVARNNGPFGVLGATVSDPVPAGILAANVSYTAVIAGGATTSVSGTQTGAINDVVSLPVNATVTYTVTVTVPFTFTGDLVNTVTITSPANSTDSNLTNNTATDTNTQAVCYRPGATGGTILDTNHGITALARAGSAAPGNWPMVRKGAWTALESRTKGFVVNRLTTSEIALIPAANLVEGMMVYNTTLDCLQVNTTGTPAGWACFNTPTCPSN